MKGSIQPNRFYIDTLILIHDSVVYRDSFVNICKYVNLRKDNCCCVFQYNVVTIVRVPILDVWNTKHLMVKYLLVVNFNLGTIDFNLINARRRNKIGGSLCLLPIEIFICISTQGELFNLFNTMTTF